MKDIKISMGMFGLSGIVQKNLVKSGYLGIKSTDWSLDATTL